MAKIGEPNVDTKQQGVYCKDTRKDPKLVEGAVWPQFYDSMVRADLKTGVQLQLHRRYTDRTRKMYVLRWNRSRSHLRFWGFLGFFASLLVLKQTVPSSVALSKAMDSYSCNHISMHLTVSRQVVAAGLHLNGFQDVPLEDNVLSFANRDGLLRITL